MSNCESCAEYNIEKHYCPKFCEVIESTLEEKYQQGREDMLNEMTQMLNIKDIVHFIVDNIALDCLDCEFAEDCDEMGNCESVILKHYEMDRGAEK